PLTQEFLGQMLGVRRTTVTIAARLLQSAGLIRYRRGLIHILDRAALEDISCECYAVVRHNLDKVFPSPPLNKYALPDGTQDAGTIGLAGPQPRLLARSGCGSQAPAPATRRGFCFASMDRTPKAD